MIHSDITAQSSDPVQATQPLREDLERIISGLDACFVQAGTALSVSVEAIDRIVSALTGIGEAMDDGTGQNPVDTLVEVARRVSDLPAQCEARSVNLSRAQASTARLRAEIGSVLDTLRLLRIYGMNVKIAAAGATEFAGFVDTMFARITSGEENVRAFNSRIAALREGAIDVVRMDKLLLQECKKVIPMVPDRLAEDAQGLRVHQQAVAGVANTARELALAIQVRVATALGAMQIGDITRQRLEHVVGGIQLLHAHQADWSGDPRDTAAATAHVLRLFAVQLNETAEEFSQQAALLVASLEGIGPEARQLLTLRNDSAASEGRAVLRQLEQSIAEIETVTNQLGEADRQTGALAKMIAETAGELTQRLNEVQGVRFDVREMAINMDLRCRRLGEIGKPVTVIAKGIWTQSDSLDTTTEVIGKEVGVLGAEAGLVGGDTDAAKIDVNQALAGSLAAIRDGASRTEQAINMAGDDASRVVDSLERTSRELAGELGLGETMVAASAALLALMPQAGEGELSEGSMALLGGLLPQIGKLYTMAKEREVHQRFAVSGTEPADAGASAAVEDDFELDDGLF